MNEEPWPRLLWYPVDVYVPVLSLQSLLQLLLAEDGMLASQGLLEAWQHLQGLLVAQHRVVVLAQHLTGGKTKPQARD